MKKDDKIRELERENAKLLIEAHRKDFIHLRVPDWKSLFAVIFSGLFCWGFSFVFMASWKLFEIGEKVFDKPETATFVQFGFIPNLLFAYLLVAGFFICLVALFKGGFYNLKSPKEYGLIAWLILGLIGWLIIGLIIGLIFGLISWLISWMISGLISELIIGLIIMMIIGLIFGLISEFN
jgi:hypothetical protein